MLYGPLVIIVSCKGAIAASIWESRFVPHRKPFVISKSCHLRNYILLMFCEHHSLDRRDCFMGDSATFNYVMEDIFVAARDLKNRLSWQQMT